MIVGLCLNVFGHKSYMLNKLENLRKKFKTSHKEKYNIFHSFIEFGCNNCENENCD
jgi:hypothetical protein